MNILVLVAGTNDPSNSNALADAFIDGMRSKDPSGTVHKIRIKDLSIDHFTMAHYDPATDQGADFLRIQKNVLESDGVVIATPIWNFSIPAHLKNLIDRMGSFGLDAETRSKGTLKSKPFYFIYTGGAPVPAWKGLMRFTTMHLGEAIRYFDGSIVGRSFEGKCMLGRGKFGYVMDKRPESLKKVHERGIRFIDFIDRFRKSGQLPLRYRLFNWAYKKGQRIMAKF